MTTTVPPPNPYRSCISVAMVQVSCCTCGVPFQMPADFHAEIKRHGRLFYCPSGHPQSYTETTEAKLTRELAKKDQQLAAKQEEIERRGQTIERVSRQVRAQKGIVTKLKNKVALGTCPCCDKLFPDLSSHMATEHPDFEAAEPEEKESEAAK